jgi:hypothetical protein
MKQYSYYLATILDHDEGDLVVYSGAGRKSPSFSYWLVPGTNFEIEQ